MEEHRDPLSRRLPLSVIAVAIVFLTSGCEATDSGQAFSPSFSRTDSAGISILTTPGEKALAPLGWTVDSVPEVVIGSGSAEGDQLYRVQGARGFDDGRILVVDGGSRQLRFFDSQGHLMRRVGRKGEGPGEFEDPLLVPLIGPDSLLVWDRYLRRFQYFSEDGQPNRTLLLHERWPAAARPPHGAVGSLMLIDEWVVDWFIPASQQTQGAKDTGVNLLWYDPVSGSRAPIASYKVTRDFIFIPPGRPPHGSQIPFTVFPDAAVTADGGLITGGTAFQIRDVGLGGEIRRILRLDLAPQPVTDAIIEAWLDSELSGPNAGTGLREQILKSMPLPDTLPAFESLLIDELGCVWAQIFEWSPEVPKQWVVFDAEGAALGAVETPPGLRVEWIGPDGILGVWKDDFDVEQVHRHRLERQRDECLVS